jgi:hypothetical protein
LHFRDIPSGDLPQFLAPGTDAEASNIVERGLKRIQIESVLLLNLNDKTNHEEIKQPATPKCASAKLLEYVLTYSRDFCNAA